MDEEWYAASYPLSSPLLRTVRVMMRNRHSDGGKRARRAKLYYLFDKDPRTYRVDAFTKEAAERTAERLQRRALQLSGKAKRKEPRGGPKESPGSKKTATAKK